MSQKIRKTNQVIVIGGGVAGLASAARLSKNGFNVHLFEQSNSLGGKMNSMQLGSYRFDTGPSLITLPHTLQQLFKRCQKNMSDYLTLNKLDIVTRYFFSDNSILNAYSDPKKFAAEVEKFSPNEGVNIEKYLKHAKFIYNRVGKLFLEQPINDWKQLIKLETLKAVLSIPQLRIFSTLHEVNQKSFKDPRLVQLFDRFATYNGSNPYKAPGILQIIAHLEHERGAYFAIGGMDAVRNALVKLCADMNVNIHTNAQISEIIVNKSVAKGIKTNNMGHLSDYVICNVDINSVYGKLLKEKYANPKYLKQPLSSSALIFLWGVSDPLEKLTLHNVIFSDNYKKEFEEIDDNTPCSNPTIYIYASNKANDEDAPKNHSNLFVMINTPPDNGQDWDAYARKIKPLIIKRMAETLGVDLSSKIEVEDYFTPKTIEVKTAAFKGALYGNSSNNKFAAFNRHPNKSNKIKNLFFVGGTVHPGGGIPLVLNSARIVSKMVKRR